MLEKTGIAAEQDLESIIPSKKRREQGPVAIIECFRPIPCDPCYHSCPSKAIREFDDINDSPQIDFDKCTGCGICIASCPGLAIFVIDEVYGENESLVKLPYEFLPLPEKGETVRLLNRAGKEVGRGRVKKVQNPAQFDKTAVIWVSIPDDLIMEVRNIKVGEEDEQ